MSLIIAGERSGVGKTTVTLALLSYLRQHQLPTQSFKVGPDYIDPMFHEYVTGRPCRNLDLVLTTEAYVQDCYTRHARTAAYVLVEGVMGLFDGAAPAIAQQKVEDHEQRRTLGGFGSTAHVAHVLNLPIVLVVDCSRMSQSIAALVHGYCHFDPNLQIAGLILNRVGSDRHLHLLQTALAPLKLPVLGVLHRQDDITIPDRHLGLLPTTEFPHLEPLITNLANLAAASFNWEKIMPLLATEQNQKLAAARSNLAPAASTSPPTHRLSPLPPALPLRIAIAHDAAFSFYYADHFDLLRTLGAELVFWSPLRDSTLPENLQGLILGGGFPEMFAAALSANLSLRKAVRAAIAAGIPTYAECGGLMYLCEAIVDFDQQAWDMVGVLPTQAVMGQRLTLGYRQVEAQQDGILLPQGATAWGHEFHRSTLTGESPKPLFVMRRQEAESSGPESDRKHQAAGKGPGEGWYLPNLHASYVHLHWGATPALPQRFLNQCHQFRNWSALNQ